MKEKLLTIMNEVFGIDNADEETSQLNCKAWNSLNHLNLIIALETEFDVSFEPEEIADMRNYREVFAQLQKKINK